MKINFKRVIVLAISFFLVITSMSFAAQVSNNSTQKEVTKNVPQVDKEKCHHKHGHRMAKGTILKDKFGITEAEFENARQSGKSIFDLTKAKGFTESQVKNVLLEENYKHIDKAVTEGKIDKAKAESIKSQMKIRMDKWDGKIKDPKDNSDHPSKQNVNN